MARASVSLHARASVRTSPRVTSDQYLLSDLAGFARLRAQAQRLSREADVEEMRASCTLESTKGGAAQAVEIRQLSDSYPQKVFPVRPLRSAVVRGGASFRPSTPVCCRRPGDVPTVFGAERSVLDLHAPTACVVSRVQRERPHCPHCVLYYAFGHVSSWSARWSAALNQAKISRSFAASSKHKKYGTVRAVLVLSSRRSADSIPFGRGLGICLAVRGIRAW